MSWLYITKNSLEHESTLTTLFNGWTERLSVIQVVRKRLTTGVPSTVDLRVWQRLQCVHQKYFEPCVHTCHPPSRRRQYTWHLTSSRLWVVPGDSRVKSRTVYRPRTLYNRLNYISYIPGTRIYPSWDLWNRVPSSSCLLRTYVLCRDLLSSHDPHIWT